MTGEPTRTASKMAPRAPAISIIVSKVKYPLRFIVSFVQPISDHELIEKHLCNPCIQKERFGATHPSYISYHLKSEVRINYASLSAMFNPLHSSTNQELFKKHLCNQNSHYEKYGRFPLLRHTTAKSTLFAVSKDEWDTKEDTGKSMKNTLYVLRYSKRHFLGQSDIEQ